MNNSRPRAVTRLSALLVACGALLLFTSQVAMAAAPRDSKKLIVVGSSIGSVKLGQEARAARAGWGGGKCHNPGPYENGETPEFDPDVGPGECTFKARRLGEASFGTTRRGGASPSHVWTVGIYAKHLRTKYRQGRFGVREIPVFAFKRPYTKFHTAKGIRLGSTAKAFRRAYRKAKRVDSEGIDAYKLQDYEIRKGRTATTFTVAGGRVSAIEIAKPFNED